MMCGSHYYCNYNEKLGALNRALDTNRDGKITLNQFMRMVEDRQGGPRKVKKSASAATPAAPESEDGVWITYSKTQARAKSSSRKRYLEKTDDGSSSPVMPHACASRRRRAIESFSGPTT